MAETFVWAIQDGPQASTKFRVLKAQFGDGYAQRVGDGLNNRSRTWPITVVGTWAELDPIEDFFLRHKGFIAFNWTPPGPNAVPGLFLCEEYSFTPRSGQNGTLTATLIEAHHP